MKFLMLQTGMKLVLSGLNLAIIKMALTGSACMLFMLVHRRQAYLYSKKDDTCRLAGLKEKKSCCH